MEKIISKQISEIKRKFDVTLIRHRWCGTMCNNLQDAEELHTEQTEILFLSLFITFNGRNMNEFVVFFSQHSRFGKMQCDTRLMFLPVVFHLSLKQVHLSSARKFWLTSII
jgi:hypothetical protein